MERRPEKHTNRQTERTKDRKTENRQMGRWADQQMLG